MNTLIKNLMRPDEGQERVSVFVKDDLVARLSYDDFLSNPKELLEHLSNIISMFGSNYLFKKHYNDVIDKLGEFHNRNEEILDSRIIIYDTFINLSCSTMNDILHFEINESRVAVRFVYNGWTNTEIIYKHTTKEDLKSMVGTMLHSGMLDYFNFEELYDVIQGCLVLDQNLEVIIGKHLNLFPIAASYNKISKRR